MDELTEIFKKPINIIFLGATVTIIGGVVTAIGTYLQNKSSSEKSSRIEKGVKDGLKIGEKTSNTALYLKFQNRKLIGKVDLQGATIDNLRRENTDLYGKLQEANKIISDNVRGGQEPLFVEAVVTDKGVYSFWLNNSNKYPVFGVTFDMIDYDELLKCKHIKQADEYVVDYPCYRQLSKGFHRSELEIGQMYLSWGNAEFGNIKFKEYGRYQIRIKTRHNIFYQQLVYRKIGDDVYTASRILISNNPSGSKHDFKVLRTIDSPIKDWKVDFDNDFPTGIVFLYAPL